jgi:hypothetical protein
MSPSIFDEYLSGLASWETELFPELHMEVDCYKFISLVNTQLLHDSKFQLITVSDGSDNSGSMTFGWVIALLGGRRLARCLAFGPFGSSFKAEIQDFCASKDKWVIK